MRKLTLSLLLAFGFTAHANESKVDIEEQSVLGHEEIVTLFPGEIQTKARIDTGAATNSMYAVNTRVFEENGEERIRFTFIDHEDNEHILTRPIVDKVTIKQASGKQTRYVVEMGLCVGNHYEESRFTLADRSRMTFPILVGRNFLENSLLVSSSEKMVASPECEVKLAKKDPEELPEVQP
ncbi:MULTISPECIES: RimK/LysX family protein [unclassified Methylophaga]|uniref:ATP-dependent zinc protease family protein n=1 Tax=unclassified Methylophaga TaxID=2629249 RepID=UPI000C8B6820|nr:MULTISPECIES: RimK/LysX family protein [unclassified Methylophaga]MAK66365.1 hypothetical protein [Methylophaga sp.]MAY17059.1 hypothetical protein [Methylophaga sp.]